MKTTLEIYRFLTESMTNKDLDKQSMPREGIMGLIDGSYSKISYMLGFNESGIGAHTEKAFAKADIIRPYSFYPVGINTFAQKIMYNISDCIFKSGLISKRNTIGAVRAKVNSFNNTKEFKNYLSFSFNEVLSYGRRISGNKHKYTNMSHGSERPSYFIESVRDVNSACKESNSGRHYIFTSTSNNIGADDNVFKFVIEVSRSRAVIDKTTVIVKNIAEQVSSVLNACGLSFTRTIHKDLIEYNIAFSKFKEAVVEEPSASTIVKEGVKKLMIEVGELNKQIKALEDQVSGKQAKIERMGIALETLKELGV